MILTEQQVRAEAQKAGFSGQALDYIVAIARRESGFDAGIYNGNESTGDNSVGLTQINMIGSLGQSRLAEINRLFGANLPNVDAAKEWLKTPANNLRYAYYISNQGTNFQPWTTAAGALADIGGVPLPGTSGGGGSVDYTSLISKYASLNPRWKELDLKVAPYEVSGQQTFFDPTSGLWALVPDGVDELGQPKTQQVQIMSAAEYKEYIDLGDQLDALEADYEKQGGNLDDLIKQATYEYNTDPRNIDAQNAADKYARDLSAINTATGIASDQLTDQHNKQNDAETSLNSWANSSGRGVFRAPATNLPSADDLFKNAIAKVKAELPDVPPRPYAPVVSMPDLGRPSLDTAAAALQPKPASIFGARNILAPINAVRNTVANAPQPTRSPLDAMPGLPGDQPATSRGIVGSVVHASVAPVNMGDYGDTRLAGFDSLKPRDGAQFGADIYAR